MTANGVDGPDRIIVAGDWHGNATRAGEAVRTAEAEGVGLLLHTGDFGVLPGASGERFLDRVEVELSRAGVAVWFIDGNHDDQYALRDQPREDDGTALIRGHIRYLPRGHRWTWHGQVWLALGGAYSVNNTRYTPGVDWWPEEIVSDTDIGAATAGVRYML
jgi:predicted phosphodiesterase